MSKKKQLDYNLWTMKLMGVKDATMDRLINNGYPEISKPVEYVGDYMMLMLQNISIFRIFFGFLMFDKTDSATQQVFYGRHSEAPFR